MSLRALLAAWNEFWFTPQSPTPIALYRILYGLTVLVYGLLLAPDFLTWFGERGVLSMETAKQITGGPRLHLLALLPPGDGWVIALFVILMLAACSLTLGLCTRTSAFLVFFGLVSFHHRDRLLLNSGDTFLRVVAFYLIFSEAGAAMSLDRLRRVMRGEERGEPPAKPPWAQRLIQVQLALVYCSTFLWKLRGSMWRDGTALYYTSRLEEFWRFPVPYVFEHLWAIKLSTWATLAMECALAVLVWIVELRYLVLGLGVLLHLGIEYSMNIPLFAWIMISAYTTFIEPRHLRWLMDGLRAQVQRRCGAPVPVFYDGHCVLCTRSARALEMLDVFRRVDLIDFRVLGATTPWPDFDLERADREMLLRTPAGRWLGGFHTFRWLAWRLPLLWFIAPLLHLPGVAALGVRVYAWVARHRSVFFGRHCDTGTCRVH